MYKVIDSRNTDFENGKYNRQCDLMCDSVEDLPSAEECEINNIGFGSVAWCISEKVYKVLNSGGDWE